MVVKTEDGLSLNREMMRLTKGHNLAVKEPFLKRPFDFILTLVGKGCCKKRDCRDSEKVGWGC